MGSELIDTLKGEGTGPIIGRELEDLDITLLAWNEGHRVETHRNDEIDVVTVVISGKGTAIVDGVEHLLAVGSLLLIPKGTERSIESRSPDFRYLNIHKRRRKLMPTLLPPRSTAKVVEE